MIDTIVGKIHWIHKNDITLSQNQDIKKNYRATSKNRYVRDDSMFGRTQSSNTE